jgi:hypothetical protein
MMHINKLVIDNSGAVSFPVQPTNPTDEFTVDISHIVVNGSGIVLDARCTITNMVELLGANGRFTFGNIGGAVSILGNNNIITAENTGNVGWGSGQKTVPNGSLQIRGGCENLNVWTQSAGIDINSVRGYGGANMQTVDGNLYIKEITAGGLRFTATGLASVSAGLVAGSVLIPEMGFGTINLTQVKGNTDIVSDKLGGAPVTISFDSTITTNPTLRIQGYDGNISASNIRGDTTITVRDAVAVGGRGAGTGRANIYAHFRRVSETVILTANTGYVAGHDEQANVTVDLDTPIWGVLDIIGTSSAENQNSAQTYLRNSYAGTGTGVTFWLQDWSVIDATPVDETLFWEIVEDAVGFPVLHSKIRVITATRFFLK